MDLYYISHFFPYKFSPLETENWPGLILYWCLFYYKSETFLLLLNLSDAANLERLIYNSPDVLSTCSLWEGSCQQGFFSPAITLSVVRPSTCRRIIKQKSITPVGFAACAAQQALQPGIVPDCSPVKLLVASQVYTRGKLLEDGKHSTEMSNIFFPGKQESCQNTRQRLFAPLQLLSFWFSSAQADWLVAGTSLRPPCHFVCCQGHHPHLSHVPSYAAASPYGTHVAFLVILTMY